MVASFSCADKREESFSLAHATIGIPLAAPHAPLPATAPPAPQLTAAAAALGAPPGARSALTAAVDGPLDAVLAATRGDNVTGAEPRRATVAGGSDTTQRDGGGECPRGDTSS
jgi:hypothetical protein